MLLVLMLLVLMLLVLLVLMLLVLLVLLVLLTRHRQAFAKQFGSSPDDLDMVGSRGDTQI